MHMLKKAMVVMTGAALMSVPAFAGQVNPQVVDVDTDFMFASGDMITAFSDKDDEVYIGCGTRNTLIPSGGMFSWAFCQARDADGDQVTCFAFDNELVETVHAINSDSYIQFRYEDDGNGGFNCTHMGFSTQSFYLDKHTKGNKVPKD